MSVGAAAEIKQKLDIVEYIGETTPLKRAGTTYKGLCPFHGEKTPSFVVTPIRDTWKCFGCGLGGDIFSFVMERDGVDFKGALQTLAQRAGIELNERTTREDAQRKRLRDAVEAAISFYHLVLTTHKAGQPALDYLRSRGFTDATIETFQLGYAPDSWDALTRALTTKRNISEKDLVDAGLARARQRGRGVYDLFRDRVIFPIRDASGHATGLGGRVIGAYDPDTQGGKYINTPAGLLFDKSRTLYLIDKAKSGIRRTGRAVIVEGNTDVLMAHQAGFDNVVGSLGTALTAGHIELITRYAPRIALAYDVDKAGQDAAAFGARELTALIGEIERSEHRGRLTDVDVVRLPAGKDPDEVIRDTPDVWRQATENPQPIIDFLIDQAASRHDLRTVPGKERFINSVVPTLRTIGDPVRRDGYVQELARRAGIDERTVLESMRRADKPSTDPRIRADQGHAGAKINLEAVLSQPGAVDPKAVEGTLDPAERTLLRLLLLHPEYAPGLLNRLTPDLLTTTPARELWKAIQSAPGVGAVGTFDRVAFVESLEPTLQAIARTLYARTDPVPTPGPELAQAIDQSLLTLQRSRLAEELEFTRAELAEAEATDDTAALRRLQQAVLDLNRKRLALDKRRADTSLLSNRRNPPQTPPATGGFA
jgi:DNA primase